MIDILAKGLLWINMKNIAAVFKALGDTTRLEIVRMLFNKELSIFNEFITTIHCIMLKNKIIPVNNKNTVIMAENRYAMTILK